MWNHTPHLSQETHFMILVRDFTIVHLGVAPHSCCFGDDLVTPVTHTLASGYPYMHAG